MVKNWRMFAAGTFHFMYSRMVPRGISAKSMRLLFRMNRRRSCRRGPCQWSCYSWSHRCCSITNMLGAWIYKKKIIRPGSPTSRRALVSGVTPAWCGSTEVRRISVIQALLVLWRKVCLDDMPLVDEEVACCFIQKWAFSRKMRVRHE